MNQQIAHVGVGRIFQRARHDAVAEQQLRAAARELRGVELQRARLWSGFLSIGAPDREGVGVCHGWKGRRTGGAGIAAGAERVAAAVSDALYTLDRQQDIGGIVDAAVIESGDPLHDIGRSGISVVNGELSHAVRRREDRTRVAAADIADGIGCIAETIVAGELDVRLEDRQSVASLVLELRHGLIHTVGAAALRVDIHRTGDEHRADRQRNHQLDEAETGHDQPS
jgi:hypothetical protein